MFLQIPREDPDAAKVHLGVYAGLTLSNDVPTDLAGEGILYAVDRLDSGIGIALAVLRDIGGNNEIDKSAKHPPHLCRRRPYFNPRVVSRVGVGAGRRDPFQDFHHRAAIEPADDGSRSSGLDSQILVVAERGGVLRGLIL